MNNLNCPDDAQSADDKHSYTPCRLHFTKTNRKRFVWEVYDNDCYVASIYILRNSDIKITVRDDFNCSSWLPEIHAQFMTHCIKRTAAVDLN